MVAQGPKLEPFAAPGLVAARVGLVAFPHHKQEAQELTAAECKYLFN